MHPQRELSRIAVRKAALLRELDRQRAECRAAAGRLTSTWAAADLVLGAWRLLAPARRGDAVERTAPAASAPGKWLQRASLAIGVLRLGLRMIRSGA